MNVNNVVLDNVKKIIKQDRKNVFNLIYYSVIDALLVLSIPLASSFVINSILAHASFFSLCAWYDYSCFICFCNDITSA